MNDQNTELLKLKAIATAREILNTEYASQRAEEYNTWSTNSQNAWRNGNTFSPFPPYFTNPALTTFQSKITYPTESDVVNKALELYNQSIAPTPVPVVQQTPVTPVAVQSFGIQSAVMEPVSIQEEPITVFGDSAPDVEIAQVELAVELEPEIVEEPVAIIEPEIIEETAVAEEMIEPEEIIIDPPYVSGIKNIYKDVGSVPAEPEVTWPPVQVDLSPQPMPAEQLVTASEEAGKLLPTILKKIEDLKLNWASKK